VKTGLSHIQLCAVETTDIIEDCFIGNYKCRALTSVLQPAPACYVSVFIPSPGQFLTCVCLRPAAASQPDVDSGVQQPRVQFALCWRNAAQGHRRRPIWLHQERLQRLRWNHCDTKVRDHPCFPLYKGVGFICVLTVFLSLLILIKPPNKFYYIFIC